MSAVQQLDVSVPVAPQRHLRLLPGVAEAPARPTRARLFRRRFAVAFAVLVVVAGAVLAGRALAAGEPPQNSVVTVQSGDTLSALAARALPGLPNREAVAAIEQANNLTSAHVQSGQRLLIPSR